MTGIYLQLGFDEMQHATHDASKIKITYVYFEARLPPREASCNRPGAACHHLPPTLDALQTARKAILGFNRVGVWCLGHLLFNRAVSPFFSYFGLRVWGECFLILGILCCDSIFHFVTLSFILWLDHLFCDSIFYFVTQILGKW